MNIIKSIAKVIILSLAIGFFAFQAYNYHLQDIESKDVIVDLPKGSGLISLSEKLKKEGLIYSEHVFKIIAVLKGFDTKLKSGEYVLNNKMTSFDILNKVSNGKVMYRRITIPEGLTVKEIKSILEKNEFLSGDISINIKEGYLLPETYTYEKGDTRNSILLQMQKAMEKSLLDVWTNRNRDIDTYIKSKEELLKLASIVEKETIIENEKPIVANVYINRLKLNMRLQADPTVIYGAENYKGDITYKMLREKNDYNTYVIFGLPKTAIANPGLNSLKAVANPESTDFLYFVADGEGGHLFSKTYKEHKKKVKRYLEIRKSKGF